MYGKGFSRAYDELGWNVWPELFAEQLLAWLRETGRTVRTALDLGCGTGVLCEALSAAGIRTLGVDLSPEMIAIARSRSPDLAYETGDMTVWRAPGSYDLVTCTGDALNHLSSPDDVRRVFENVYACLKPGGVFVFDLLSEREAEESGPVELWREGGERCLFSIRRGPEGAVDLSVSLVREDGTGWEEHIRETLHDPEAVCGMLRGAGFSGVTCRHRLAESAEDRALTWFVFAHRD